MTTRVLVTGGLGFIGGHLAERLLRQPDVHVTVVDDLSGAAPHAADDLLANLGHTGRSADRPCHLLGRALLHVRPE
jgi:nucleoside-diphosphate-sugar epimerase